MKNIERDELVNAVLVSRDEIDPDLETELLKDIVDAEADSGDDPDAAMRAINVALTNAVNRHATITDTEKTIPVDFTADSKVREGDD